MNSRNHNIKRTKVFSFLLINMLLIETSGTIIIVYSDEGSLELPSDIPDEAIDWTYDEWLTHWIDFNNLTEDEFQNLDQSNKQLLIRHAELMHGYCNGYYTKADVVQEIDQMHHSGVMGSAWWWSQYGSVREEIFWQDIDESEGNSMTDALVRVAFLAGCGILFEDLAKVYVYLSENAQHGYNMPRQEFILPDGTDPPSPSGNWQELNVIKDGDLDQDQKHWSGNVDVNAYMHAEIANPGFISSHVEFCFQIVIVYWNWGNLKERCTQYYWNNYRIHIYEPRQPLTIQDDDNAPPEITITSFNWDINEIVDENPVTLTPGTAANMIWRIELYDESGIKEVRFDIMEYDGTEFNVIESETIGSFSGNLIHDIPYPILPGTYKLRVRAIDNDNDRWDVDFLDQTAISPYVIIYTDSVQLNPTSGNFNYPHGNDWFRYDGQSYCGIAHFSNYFPGEPSYEDVFTEAMYLFFSKIGYLVFTNLQTENRREFKRDLIRPALLADYYETSLYVVHESHGSESELGSPWLRPSWTPTEINPVRDTDMSDIFAKNNWNNPEIPEDLDFIDEYCIDNIKEIVWHGGPCFFMSTKPWFGDSPGEGIKTKLPSILSECSDSGVVLGSDGTTGTDGDLYNFWCDFLHHFPSDHEIDWLGGFTDISSTNQPIWIDGNAQTFNEAFSRNLQSSTSHQYSYEMWGDYSTESQFSPGSILCDEGDDYGLDQFTYSATIPKFQGIPNPTMLRKTVGSTKFPKIEKGFNSDSDTWFIDIEINPSFGIDSIMTLEYLDFDPILTIQHNHISQEIVAEINDIDYPLGAFEEKWQNIKIAVNEIQETIDIYVDNNLLYDGLSISNLEGTDNLKLQIKLDGTYEDGGSIFINDITVFSNSPIEPVELNANFLVPTEVEEGSLNIQFTPNAALQKAYYSLNDQTNLLSIPEYDPNDGLPLPNYRFDLSLPNEPGTHNVRFFAQDVNGQEYILEEQIVVEDDDDEYPVIDDVLYPSEVSDSEKNIPIYITAYDTISGLSEVSVEVGNNEYKAEPTGDPNTYVTYIPQLLSLPENQIVIVATDADDESSEDDALTTKRIIIFNATDDDTTEPIIETPESIEFSDKHIAKSANILSFNISDPSGEYDTEISGIASIQHQLDSSIPVTTIYDPSQQNVEYNIQINNTLGNHKITFNIQDADNDRYLDHLNQTFCFNYTIFDDDTSVPALIDINTPHEIGLDEMIPVYINACDSSGFSYVNISLTPLEGANSGIKYNCISDFINTSDTIISETYYISMVTDEYNLNNIDFDVIIELMDGDNDRDGDAIKSTFQQTIHADDDYTAPMINISDFNFNTFSWNLSIWDNDGENDSIATAEITISDDSGAIIFEDIISEEDGNRVIFLPLTTGIYELQITASNNDFDYNDPNDVEYAYYQSQVSLTLEDAYRCVDFTFETTKHEIDKRLRPILGFLLNIPIKISQDLVCSAYNSIEDNFTTCAQMKNTLSQALLEIANVKNLVFSWLNLISDEDEVFIANSLDGLIGDIDILKTL